MITQKICHKLNSIDIDVLTHAVWYFCMVEFFSVVLGGLRWLNNNEGFSFLFHVAIQSAILWLAIIVIYFTGEKVCDFIDFCIDKCEKIYSYLLPKTRFYDMVKRSIANLKGHCKKHHSKEANR